MSQRSGRTRGHSGGYVYDTGMLIKVDQGNRAGVILHAALTAAEIVPQVPAGAVGQAWRHARQVRLARLLAGCDVVPLDDAAARAAGALCGRVGASDVIDASVVLLAAKRGDTVITTDPNDLTRLAGHLPTDSQQPTVRTVH